jgi:hypothetical protein
MSSFAAKRRARVIKIDSDDDEVNSAGASGAPEGEPSQLLPGTLLMESVALTEWTQSLHSRP